MQRSGSGAALLAVPRHGRLLMRRRRVKLCAGVEVPSSQTLRSSDKVLDQEYAKHSMTHPLRFWLTREH